MSNDEQDRYTGDEGARRRESASSERCPRLDELVVSFGWLRGGSFWVRTTIDDRDVRFACGPFRRIELHWDCGVSWRRDLPRRKRKQAKKRAAELLALALDPAARRLLESASRPSHSGPIEEGFDVGTAALSYRVTGDPPPADKVVEIAEVLTATAARIESFLEPASS
jgi:hypothetical protein